MKIRIRHVDSGSSMLIGFNLRVCVCQCVRAFVSSKFLYLIQWTVKCAEMLDYCFSPSRRLVLLASSAHHFPHFPPAFPTAHNLPFPLCAHPLFVCYCWRRGSFPLLLAVLQCLPLPPTISNCTPFHEDNALITPPKENPRRAGKSERNWAICLHTK